MAASTVTALPDPQWRIMNRTNSRTGQPATPLLARCDASIDDLIALTDRELIEGRLDDGNVDLGLLAHDRGLLNDYDIRVTLSAAGVEWVQQNPSNRALTALDTVAGRHPAKLTDVVKAAEVDAELFLLLDHAGLVTFSLPNGHDISPVGTLMLRSYRRSLLVQLTTKAIDIIG